MSIPTLPSEDTECRPASEVPNAAPLSAERLLQRCTQLHNELEVFREHLKRTIGDQTVESSHYRSLVKSELRNLEKLARRERELAHAAADQTESTPHGDDVHGKKITMPDGSEVDDQDGVAKQHVLSSSNLPFLESVWTAAKNTSGVRALNKAFYFGAELEFPLCQAKGTRSRPQSHRTSVRQGKALVDVVAKEGLEWIKVSLITNHRMLMDKAREGWYGEESDQESEDDDDFGGSNDEGDDDIDSGIPIVRMAEALAEAARLVRIRTRHPTVRLIMPKILEGQTPEVDKIIARFRALGLQVECGSEALQPKSLSSVLAKVFHEPFSSFTATVNIDCTILLALVSDFSHIEVEDEPWFHRALKRQIEMENKENYLPCIMYPALSGHDMVCTYEAAKRMREIVDTIGTPSEKARTELFLSNENTAQPEMSAEDRRRGLQTWSRFPVPDTLHLPVRALAQDQTPESHASLPAVAEDVQAKLVPINQSVFMYGWANQITTLTSNRTVVKQMEGILDRNAKDENDWPRIWLCPTARSLVGKEKQRGT